MILGTWSHAALITLLAFIAVGCVIVRPKTRGASRLRKLRNVPLPDPWSGAIVRHQKFYMSNWTASAGRAYRAMAADRSN